MRPTNSSNYWEELEQIQSYGKGSIVGEAGELEHGALWHVPGGYAMREALGGALAIVPSAKKVGGIGCRMDIPITHINASYVRSHFDAMEVYVQDAPRANEIILWTDYDNRRTYTCTCRRIGSRADFSK